MKRPREDLNLRPAGLRLLIFSQQVTATPELNWHGFRDGNSHRQVLSFQLRLKFFSSHGCKFLKFYPLFHQHGEIQELRDTCHTRNTRIFHPLIQLIFSYISVFFQRYKLPLFSYLSIPLKSTDALPAELLGQI